MVRELSTQARQPMPRLYISPTEAPNAFATGRNPRNAAVCCTDGILRLLDERELRGVIGHELSHVYNRDILISSVAGALASVIMFLVNFAWLIPVGRSDDDDGPGLFGMLLIMILRAARRQPDPTGHQPLPGVRGGRLRRPAHRRPARPRQRPAQAGDGHQAAAAAPEPRIETASHMMIANPFRPGQGLSKMFSTHPPMAERIARLEKMAGRP